MMSKEEEKNELLLTRTPSPMPLSREESRLINHDIPEVISMLKYSDSLTV